MNRFLWPSSPPLVLIDVLVIAVHRSPRPNRSSSRSSASRSAAGTDAGLHMKVPFIQTVYPFDKRWLEWSGDPNQIPTRDKKYIWVDAFTRWRIEDPLLFYQRVTDERSAQSRLDDIVDGETRNVIANNDLIEVVRSTDRVFPRPRRTRT